MSQRAPFSEFEGVPAQLIDGEAKHLRSPTCSRRQCVRQVGTEHELCTPSRSSKPRRYYAYLNVHRLFGNDGDHSSIGRSSVKKRVTVTMDEMGLEIPASCGLVKTPRSRHHVLCVHLAHDVFG